jgi:hypothetical protein
MRQPSSVSSLEGHFAAETLNDRCFSDGRAKKSAELKEGK